MSSDRPMTGAGDKDAKALLSRNQPVWVQCKGFRCLAVQDGGKWKTFFDRKELTGEVTVIANPAR